MGAELEVKNRLSSSSFCDTMLLSAEPIDGKAVPKCLFSEGWATIFHTKNFEEYGYPYIQIFEPNVLLEIGVLNNLRFKQLEGMETSLSPISDHLKAMKDGHSELSNPKLSNLIASLISLSRFKSASFYLHILFGRKLCPRGKFEASWLGFLISNRCDDGLDTQRYFDEMIDVVKAEKIPVGRIVDLCTQGVVWYLKRKEIDKETFRWCLATGHSLSQRTIDCDPETTSSWYRGLAMLPAATGDKKNTREYMVLAKEQAVLAMTKNNTPQDAKSKNQLKTYYESSIKEYLYVNRNKKRALNAAEKLIELDPLWSINYGETADIYSSFGDHDLAANYYLKAANLGPPYVGYHLSRAVSENMKIGRLDQAQHCRQLLSVITD